MLVALEPPFSRGLPHFFLPAPSAAARRHTAFCRRRLFHRCLRRRVSRPRQRAAARRCCCCCCCGGGGGGGGGGTSGAAGGGTAGCSSVTLCLRACLSVCVRPSACLCRNAHICCASVSVHSQPVFLMRALSFCLYRTGVKLSCGVEGDGFESRSSHLSAAHGASAASEPCMRVCARSAAQSQGFATVNVL